MDPPELASEPPRSHIGAASNSARAFKSIGLGNVRDQGWGEHPPHLMQHILPKNVQPSQQSQVTDKLSYGKEKKQSLKYTQYFTLDDLYVFLMNFNTNKCYSTNVY